MAKLRLQINTLKMIEVVVNDRLGKKVRVKCLAEDSVGDFKKVLSLQIGTQPNKIVLQKGGSVLKDHISLEDYEVHDQTNLELYYLLKMRCFFFFDLNTQYIHLQPREIEYVEIIRWRCLYNAFLLFSKLQEVINMSVRSRSGLVYI